jgi:hypothetical protein
MRNLLFGLCGFIFGTLKFVFGLVFFLAAIFVGSTPD